MRAGALAVVAALAVAPAGALGALGCGSGASGHAGKPKLHPAAAAPPALSAAERARRAALADREPPRQVPGVGSVAAYLRRRVELYASPGGARVAPIPPRTTFHSPRVLAVLARRGDWLRVLAAEVPGNEPGWIPARGVELFRVPFAIDVSLSERRLTVYRGRRVILETAVAVGAPGTETPPGAFAVTDKLLFDSPGGPYGCCALALTGHQPRIAQGWGGGDRLAIHGTDRPSSIGTAASLGCLRADGRVMRRLVRLIPIATRVNIRS